MYSGSFARSRSRQCQILRRVLPPFSASGSATSRLSGNIFALVGSRYSHRRVSRQRPELDFPQLDAEAANLHLMIQAAQKLNVSARQIPHQIAGLVKTRSGLGLNGSAMNLSAVAPADANIRAPARRRRSAIRQARRSEQDDPYVHDIELSVGDRAADRDWLASEFARTTTKSSSLSGHRRSRLPSLASAIHRRAQARSLRRRTAPVARDCQTNPPRSASPTSPAWPA